MIGCAGIEPPTPDKLLTHPIGTGPLHLGMTKDEVKGAWGDPDLVQGISSSKDMGSTVREEWIYYGRITNLPINCGYLSKTVHLSFDGNSLTNFKEE